MILAHHRIPGRDFLTLLGKGINHKLRRIACDIVRPLLGVGEDLEEVRSIDEGMRPGAVEVFVLGDEVSGEGVGVFVVEPAIFGAGFGEDVVNPMPVAAGMDFGTETVAHVGVEPFGCPRFMDALCDKMCPLVGGRIFLCVVRHT